MAMRRGVVGRIIAYLSIGFWISLDIARFVLSRRGFPALAEQLEFLDDLLEAVFTAGVAVCMEMLARRGRWTPILCLRTFAFAFAMLAVADLLSRPYELLFALPGFILLLATLVLWRREWSTSNRAT
ncbi:MAG: hypothetical protein M3Q65_16200 [Chloroflexota bacterium]|nr:hypothetical protein [Chloroflexota bacterium]